jgi:cytochrome c-type biogenesis protein
VTGTEDVASGSLVVAAAISIAAGAVSFASPCVLPLVPGYLAFVSGLSGADLAGQVEGRRPARGAVVAGAGLFVLGFAAFFTLIGGAFGALGQVLVAQRGLLGRLGGILVAALGLFLLGVWRPQRLERERRALGLVRRGGLLAAFPLGVVFGAGWTPCIGPTLAAILTLTTVGQDTSPARGAVLAFAYALGLGVPFLLIAVALRSGMGAVRRLRRHARTVERLSGALLVVVGVLLVTGLWDRFIALLQPLIGGFQTPL